MANLSPIQLTPVVQTNNGDVPNAGAEEGNSGFSEELQDAISLQNLKSEDSAAVIATQENEVSQVLTQDPALQILPLVNWIPGVLPANFASASGPEGTARTDSGAISGVALSAQPLGDKLDATLPGLQTAILQPPSLMDATVADLAPSDKVQSQEKTQSIASLATVSTQERVLGQESLAAPSLSAASPDTVTTLTPAPQVTQSAIAVVQQTLDLSVVENADSLPTTSEISPAVVVGQDSEKLIATPVALTANKGAGLGELPSIDGRAEEAGLVAAHSPNRLAQVTQTSPQASPIPMTRSALPNPVGPANENTLAVQSAAQAEPTASQALLDREALSVPDADGRTAQATSPSDLPLTGRVSATVQQGEKTFDTADTPDAKRAALSTAQITSGQSIPAATEASQITLSSTQGFQAASPRPEVVPGGITTALPSASAQVSPQRSLDAKPEDVAGLTALAPLVEGDVSGVKASITPVAHRVGAAPAKTDVQSFSVPLQGADSVVNALASAQPMTADPSAKPGSEEEEALAAAPSVAANLREADSASPATPATTFLSTLIGQPVASPGAKELTWLQSAPLPHPMEPHEVKLDAGQVQVEILRMVKQGGGQVIMELTPPDQSKFRIDLQIDAQGQAILVVEGASDSTRTRLEQGASGLQQQFADMGLQLQLDMRQSRDFGERQNAAQLTSQNGGVDQPERPTAELRAEALSAQRASRREAAEGNVHLYA